MHRTTRRVVGAAVAGVSALALSAGTAHAVAQQTEPAGTQALSEMTLTVSPGDFSSGTSVTLECDPAGGTHPTPADACASLTAVAGDFSRLPRVPGYLCLAVYDPVTVSATGSWQGRPVFYHETFTNSCEAAVGTDWVYRLGPR